MLAKPQGSLLRSLSCSGLTQVSEVPQCLGDRVQPGETLGPCPQPAWDTRHLQALASPCGPGLGSIPSAQNSPALMAEFQELWWAALLCPLICRKNGERDRPPCSPHYQ